LQDGQIEIDDRNGGLSPQNQLKEVENAGK
jgi:hypothetical protein